VTGYALGLSLLMIATTPIIVHRPIQSIGSSNPLTFNKLSLLTSNKVPPTGTKLGGLI